MSVSRVGKLLCEVGRVESLAEADQLRSAPVHVLVGTGEPQKIATLAHAAVALALRTQRGPVRVFVDLAAPGVGGVGRLLDDLYREAEAYGEAHRLEHMPAQSAGAGIGLLIDRLGSGVHSRADAAGWVSAINRTLTPSLGAEATACVFAVACAFAKQFKAGLLQDQRSLGEQWSFDLHSLQVDPPPPTEYRSSSPHLGSVALLGAGAIGSAVAYVLSLSGWHADLTILDKGLYEEPNEETTLMVSRRQVFASEPKAETLATLLDGGVLRARGRRAEINAQSAELHEPYDQFICAVDNESTRRALDAIASPTLINAAVGGSRYDAGHVLMSRHSLHDPPLSSLYPMADSVGQETGTAFVPTEARDACSRVAYQNVSLAAPFIAAAAASLAVSECERAAQGLLHGPNYLKLDLFGLQSRLQRDRRSARRA